MTLDYNEFVIAQSSIRYVAGNQIINKSIRNSMAEALDSMVTIYFVGKAYQEALGKIDDIIHEKGNLSFEDYDKISQELSVDVLKAGIE